MRPGLYGLKAAPQGMRTPRKGGVSGAPFVTNLTPGVTTWTVPSAGLYKFHLWGAGRGGTSGQGGCSGGYCEITERLSQGAVIAVLVGIGRNALDGGDGDTQVTLPSGRVALAARGTAIGTAGLATGGDVNLNGSLGGVSAGGPPGVAGLGSGGAPGGLGDNASRGGGGGAPGVLPMRGASTISNASPGGTPGAGGSGDDGAGGATNGGSGLIIILKIQ